MSGTYIFEFRTQAPSDEIYAELKRLWRGTAVELFASPTHQGHLMCDLGYPSWTKEELDAIGTIVAYLFSISSDSEIWYYRWYDTIEDVWDFPREIEVEELSRAEFAPAIYDGLQYRYKMKRPVPSRR